MKLSCLIAFAVLLFSAYFIFKFLHNVFLILRNPFKYRNNPFKRYK